MTHSITCTTDSALLAIGSLIKHDSETMLERSECKKYGYIYVIGFANGIVKVGKTRNFATRLKQHQSTIGRAVSIDNLWSSPLHFNYGESERLLIGFIGSKTEFKKTNVNQVIDFAKSINFLIESDDCFLARKDLEEKDCEKRTASMLAWFSSTMRA
jgi:hypothetical protein